MTASTLGSFYIGWAGSSSGSTEHSIKGYITDFKLDIGGNNAFDATATSITVPTERATLGNNTKLFACHLPYLKDGSTSDHTLSFVGSSTGIKPIGPYDYSEYSKSINGGSVHYDGTGDYLTLPAAPTLGTSEFEISMWVYPETISGADVIIDWRPSSTNGVYVNFFLDSGVPKLFVDSADRITGSSALPVKVWSYLTLTRVSGSTKLYVNGTQSGSTYSDSNNYLTGSSRPAIGQAGYNPSLNLGFNGYMSDLVVKLSGNSSPSIPTEPVSSSGTSLHIKGTDAHVIDKSQVNNLKLVGSTNETESPYSSGRSIGLTNSISTYVEIPKRDELLLGDTFTIEGWIKPTSLSNGYNTVFTGNGYGYYLAVRSNGGLNFYSTNSGAPNYDTAAGVITNNTWHYVAAVCSSGTLTLYSGTSSSNFAARGHGSGGAENSVSGFNLNNFGSNFNGGNTRFGVTHVSSQGFAGYLTDWRFSKGIARTVTFPSAPLKG